jgi:mono/diheme cytochrome c family protein
VRAVSRARRSSIAHEEDAMRAHERRDPAARAARVALSLALLAAPLRASEATPDRGREVYRQQCALCHGSEGRADGPAAYLLFPPARDFGRGTFKLASTVNGVPTQDDLVATLRRGMPGSAMPSWDWMPEEDLRAVAEHVRELAARAVLEELRQELGERADGELATIARERLTPGAPLPLDPPAPATPETLRLGREVYLASCAGCHGEDGRGRPGTVRRDEDGVINHARDFTSGILRGGATHADLSRRLQGGVHGTAMPGLPLEPERRSALVTYVRHLIPQGAEERLVQRRTSLTAERISPDPEARDARDWNWTEAREARLALAPLWWNDGAIQEVRIAALHDGEFLALRLRWSDDSADGPEAGLPPYADAVAVQLSADEHPPFFGMGHGASMTNLWHWRALDLFDLSQYDALISLFPHRIGDWLTPDDLRASPYHQLAAGPVVVAGEAVAVRPAGMRVLPRQEGLPEPIDADASWAEGEWQVVLQRRLEPASPRELGLVPGGRVSFDLALWNGAIRDLRGQKSVSIWHELVLAP